MKINHIGRAKRWPNKLGWDFGRAFQAVKVLGQWHVGQYHDNSPMSHRFGIGKTLHEAFASLAPVNRDS